MNRKEIYEDCKSNESQPLFPGDGEDRLAGNLSDATKAKSMWKDTNWRQKSIVIYVSTVNYIYFVCYSACSPFLARVMLQKGGTVVLSTVMFQSSMLTMAAFSLVFGKYQTRIGSKTLLMSGQVIFSLSQIAFGVTGYIENYWAFTAVGTILKLLQGICEAATFVAGLTIVCQELPDFLSTVYGIFEAGYGFGYLTGPYIGGFLYDWSNGMMAPMAITGLFFLLFSLTGFGILKKTENYQEPDSDSHIGRIMSDPKAVFIIGAGGTMIGGLGLSDSTITLYLKKEGFSATKVGQFLFLMGLAYCLFTVGTGFAINSRKVLRRFAISIGILGGFAFPFLWVPNQLVSWIYVAAFGYAMCAALAFISAFEELRHVVQSDGTASSDFSLNSALSGLWSASIAIFSFICSLIGSAMEMSVSFFLSFVASLLIGFGCTIFVTLISAFYKRINKK